MNCFSACNSICNCGHLNKCNTPQPTSMSSSTQTITTISTKLNDGRNKIIVSSTIETNSNTVETSDGLKSSKKFNIFYF